MKRLLLYNELKVNYPSSWHIPYELLLQTKEWNDFREKILNRDSNKCTVCKQEASTKRKGKYYRVLTPKEQLESQKEVEVDLIGDGTFVIKTKTAPILATPTDQPVILHVHHKYYIFGNSPWEYPHDGLITVCHGCHIKIHNAQIIPVYLDESKREQLSLTLCQRCKGTGFMPEYYYYQNGICFSCCGRKFVEFIPKGDK